MEKISPDRAEKPDVHRFGSAAHQPGQVSLWQVKQALTEQVETMSPAMAPGSRRDPQGEQPDRG